MTSLFARTTAAMRANAWIVGRLVPGSRTILAAQILRQRRLLRAARWKRKAQRRFCRYTGTMGTEYTGGLAKDLREMQSRLEAALQRSEAAFEGALQRAMRMDRDRELAEALAAAEAAQGKVVEGAGVTAAALAREATALRRLTVNRLVAIATTVAAFVVAIAVPATYRGAGAPPPELDESVEARAAELDQRADATDARLGALEHELDELRKSTAGRLDLVLQRLAEMQPPPPQRKAKRP